VGYNELAGNFVVLYLFDAHRLVIFGWEKYKKMNMLSNYFGYLCFSFW